MSTRNVSIEGLLCALAWLGSASVAQAVVIAGKVTDSATHQALANVDVAVAYLGFCPTYVAADSTNADGNYRIDAVDGLSPFEFTATLDGYVPLENSIAPATGVNTYDVALHRAISISGTLLDANSQPPLQSNVILLDASSKPTGESAIADATGAYSFTGLMPGTYGVCYVNDYDDYRNVCYNQMLIGADGVAHATPITGSAGQAITGIDIRVLQNGATLTGTLTDRTTNQPITNIEIVATVYDAAQQPVQQLYLGSDNSGNYRIAGLAPGSYYLAISTPFYDFNKTYVSHIFGGDDCPPPVYNPGGSVTDFCSFNGAQPITVPAGGISGIDFALSSGEVVTGRVTDAATGAGLAGVNVLACQSDGVATAGGQTDVDGNYRITNLHNHFRVRTDVDAGHENLLWPHTIVRTGNDCYSTDPQTLISLPSETSTITGVDFALDTSTTMSGQVLTADGTQGVAARVAFLTGGPQGAALERDMATNADGTFQVSGLASATYYVVAYSTDGGFCAVWYYNGCGNHWTPSDPTSVDLANASGITLVPGTVYEYVLFVTDYLFISNFE